MTIALAGLCCVVAKVGTAVVWAPCPAKWLLPGSAETHEEDILKMTGFMQMHGPAAYAYRILRSRNGRADAKTVGSRRQALASRDMVVSVRDRSMEQTGSRFRWEKVADDDMAGIHEVQFVVPPRRISR